MTQEDRRNAAVSETVGYILLFGVVILSTGFIYAIGYPTLQSNIDASIFESAEQSFIELQSSMERAAFDQTPMKIHKIKLQNSAISVSNESSMTITYDSNQTLFIPTGEIEFQKNNKILVYEMGAVIKSYPRKSMAMISEPPIYVNTINNATLTTIGLISVNGDNSVSGKGMATLNLKHNSSSMYRTSSPTNVTIDINSTHASKWQEYLDDIGFSVTNSTSSTVTADMNNTMLILSRHAVDVEIY